MEAVDKLYSLTANDRQPYKHVRRRTERRKEARNDILLTKYIEWKITSTTVRV